MPQPLKKWDAKIRFDPESLAQRPKLAIKIAQVAAAWTNLEVHIGFLLADIMQSKADVGVTMYLALSGSAAQEAVFTAVAEKYVPGKHMEKLAALLKTIRKRAKERNAIIHATWSLHPDDEAALINCPPQSVILEMGHMISHFKTHGETSTTYEHSLAGVMIYKEQDFEDLLARFKEVRKAIDEFKADFEKFREELFQHIRELGDAAAKALGIAHQDKPQETPPKSPEHGQ